MYSITSIIELLLFTLPLYLNLYIIFCILDYSYCQASCCYVTTWMKIKYNACTIQYNKLMKTEQLSICKPNMWKEYKFKFAYSQVRYDDREAQKIRLLGITMSPNFHTYRLTSMYSCNCLVRNKSLHVCSFCFDLGNMVSSLLLQSSLILNLSFEIHF